MRTYLAVLGFGAVGVSARYFLDLLAVQWVTVPFPVATFLINISGSFAMGWFFTQGASVGVTVGLLGGFTTFSALSMQTLLLLRDGRVGLALTYLIGSPVVGLLAAWAGTMFMRGR